jgi:hypothetical protein
MPTHSVVLIDVLEEDSRNAVMVPVPVTFQVTPSGICAVTKDEEDAPEGGPLAQDELCGSAMSHVELGGVVPSCCGEEPLQGGKPGIGVVHALPVQGGVLVQDTVVVPFWHEVPVEPFTGCPLFGGVA